MTINKLYRFVLQTATLLLPLLMIAPHAAAQNRDDVPATVMVSGIDVLPVVSNTIISSITITGNKKTKDMIILREITFAEGDTLATETLAQEFDRSKTNLLKTSLFNYVTITATEIETGFAAVTINVEERWYIWPSFDITPHNGNLNQWLRDPDIHKVDVVFGAKKYNFRGRREILSFNFRRGFNNISQIGYSNIAVDRKYRHLLATYLAVKTQKDVLVRTTDGVGEYNRFGNNALREIKPELIYQYRQTINASHYLKMAYNDVSICDSLAALNPDFLGDGATHIRNITTAYSFRIDNRSSSYYPLTGSFYEVTFKRTGYLSESPTVLGAEADVRHYFQVSDRIYLAAQAYVATYTNNTPFYMRPNLGSKPNIFEGYEHNLIYGDAISFIKTSYKFELLPTRIIHIKRINVPKFNKIHIASYLNLFANCAYVEDHGDTDSLRNPYNNTFIGSFGVGLDLVTYYDKAFSLYITRNIQNQCYIGIGLKSFF
ncbi:MAG: hypothetical protein J6V76_02260 [Bacteroidales bacterium]|nr:hypothetical protein [Bacteroidales bacterium]MBO7141915.1 hypothetical protein [Bacteroidales bacterium]